MSFRVPAKNIAVDVFGSDAAMDADVLSGGDGGRNHSFRELFEPTSEFQTLGLGNDDRVAVASDRRNVRLSGSCKKRRNVNGREG